MNKYSVVPLLVSAVRDAICECHGDDARRRLFLVPRAHVCKLVTSDSTVTGIELYYEGELWRIPVPSGCAVILANTSIESTRLALESFPTTGDPATELIGRNFTVHMRSDTPLKIKKSALDPALPEMLQTAALLIRADTGAGEFHLQLTAADDPCGDSDSLLFKMIPDIDQVDELLARQQSDFVALTIRGCAQMFGDKVTPIHDPNKRWIDLSPFDFDEFGYRRAYVHTALEPDDAELWNAMDASTRALALALAGGDDSALELGATVRNGLGTTYHETGTMWMGTDPASSVTDVNGKFHHVTNAYVCDQSLFPTVGSINPVLTGMVLARKVAEAIVAAHPYR
jgi:choline dehydrogenase-like flavoprotein